jgi:starvation-inducible DNA-binding protein
MNHNMRVEKPELVEALARLLGDNVVFYTKAHGHHWNVMGRDFSQFHDFFEEIYEDAFAQFDPVAENIRKMGALAPYKLSDFANLSSISDMEVGSDAMLMCEDLLVANNVLIESINVAFKIASDLDEQGIADYLAGRDDEHKKLRWQLTSFLSPQRADALGKSDAVQPLDADMTDEVLPVVEQLMDDANGCPLCGYGECGCPASDGGACLCGEECPCHHCHVVMDEESYTLQDQYFSFQEEQIDALQAAGIIVAEEQDLAKALLEIAEEYGKFNEDRTGIWAGYTPPEENDVKDIGVKCINCVLYEGPGVCKIIAQPIEDDGKCRFAVIPDGVVKVEDDQITASAVNFDEPFDELSAHEYDALIAAGKSPCWDGYKQVGMKKGKKGNMVPNCVPVDAADDSDSDAELAASRRAPKKDRIYGSKRNKPGSAAGSKKIVFSDKVETALRNKVEEHNKNSKPGRKATLPMLKAVYRRGAGAFSSSHRPGKTRDQWAMARVNAFLKLLKSGSPANPNYKQDNDLLPKAHPKSSRGEAAVLQHELLQVALKSADEYGSPEHAIFSMAEYSGMGYEVIPALRGAWLRGVRDGDVPFSRAYELATKLYESKDADLLPKKQRKATGE